MNLYDLHQNQRIAQSEQDSQRANRGVQQNESALLELQKSVRRLTLICNAMWQILQEATELSDEDLMNKVKELEKQSVAAPLTCPQCGRVQASQKAGHCLYCGALLPKEEVADRLFQI